MSGDRPSKFRANYQPTSVVVRRGNATVSTTASRTGSIIVTFTPAFATTPTVVATTEDTSYMCAVFGRTTAQFQLFVSHIDGTALTTAVAVNWIATTA